MTDPVKKSEPYGISMVLLCRKQEEKKWEEGVKNKYIWWINLTDIGIFAGTGRSSGWSRIPHQPSLSQSSSLSDACTSTHPCLGSSVVVTVVEARRYLSRRTRRYGLEIRGRLRLMDPTP